MADVVEHLAQRLDGRVGHFRLATLLKNSEITPSIQSHLLRVYLTLTFGLLAASAGAWFGMTVFSLGPLLPSLAFIGLCTWLAWTPNTEQNKNKRFTLFLAAAGTNGLSLAPLCALAFDVAPGLLFTALGGTAAVFGCFSLSALVARRRSYLYLSAILSSALSFMLWTRFALGLFGRGMMGFEAELWVGLVVFLGYVLVDTQVIVEKAAAGDRDSVGHALQLFLDFAAVFVRVLVLLLKSQEKRGQRREQQERAGRRDGRRATNARYY